jgi:Protein of unknown function (DUF1320).
MMITIDEFKNALGSKVNTITAGFTDDKLTALITEQSNLISNILTSITIPEEIPALLKKICKDFCVYELYSRQSRGDLPDSIQKAQENGYKLLDKILKKQIVFGTSSSPTTEEVQAVMSVRTQVFTQSI